MEILRKNEKEILEIENIIRKMKNAFGGLVGLDMTEVSISELEEMLIETSKAKKQRAKMTEKDRTKCLRTVGQKIMSIQWEYQKEKTERKGQKKYLKQ